MIELLQIGDTVVSVPAFIVNLGLAYIGIMGIIFAIVLFFIIMQFRSISKRMNSNRNRF